MLDEDSMLDKDDVIETLGLAPHPEGGWYRETWRAPAPPGARAPWTAIYFILDREPTRWHRVDADEMWHHYAGATVVLETAQDGEVVESRLGTALHRGEQPQYLVRAGEWQRAQSLGAWTLVGCTVVPGFMFSGFEAVDELPIVGPGRSR